MSMPKVCDSSTVMTPSLPTTSIASAILSPISSSAAEMAPTCAISSRSSISLALLLISLDDRVDGLLDAAADGERVGAGRHVAQALGHDDLGEQRGGGGAVTGDVVGLDGDFLDELSAHVLERVLELDLLGDGHAVVGDGRRAELLLEHDVAALGAERHLDGVGQLVDTGREAVTGLLVETDLFGHCCSVLLLDSHAIRTACAVDATSPRRRRRCRRREGSGSPRRRP